MKWKQIAIRVLVALTTVQLVALLVTLYLWGFGVHVPEELGMAIIWGSLLTGIPIGFLVIE